MWKRIFISMLVFIILVGCGTQNGVSTTPTSIPPSTSTQQTLDPTPTNLSTKTPTFIPFPTLSYETQRENLTDLLITNGGCDFPCWWGINIGDPIRKVSNLAPRVGKPLDLYGNSIYSYSFSLGILNTPDFYIEFLVDSDQNIRSIEIRLEKPVYFKDYYESFEKRLSLPNILAQYGKPDEVLVIIQPRIEPTIEARPYKLFLIYEKQSFGILYSGVVNSENPLKICSIELIDYRLSYIQLFLQNPLLKIPELSYPNKFYQLDEVTSVNLDDFSTLFSKAENNYCIEILDDKWQ